MRLSSVENKVDELMVAVLRGEDAKRASEDNGIQVGGKVKMVKRVALSMKKGS
jgi:hypothetical protein